MPSARSEVRGRWVSGLLVGLAAGLAFSGLLAVLTRSSAGAVIFLPFLFLGGSAWRRRPFLAAFLLGFSLGGLAQLLRPLFRTLL